MDRVVFVTDRPPHDILPALPFHIIVESFDAGLVERVLDIGPALVIVDGQGQPERAYSAMDSLAEAHTRMPLVAMVPSEDFGRCLWEEVADELITPGASQAEVRTRLAMVLRRLGETGRAVLRVGPLSLNPDTYQVRLERRVLDLT